MRVNVYSEKGIKTASTVELPKEIFAVEPNEAVLRQYLHVYRLNQRQGTVSTKTRGEVRGGGRKPWAQKGTGRARQGSIRSPIWVGGGVAHGPKPHDFEADLPKKMRALALSSALTLKAAAKQVFVLKDFAPKVPKTAQGAALLKRLGLKKTLVVLPGTNESAQRSFRNIKGVRIKIAGALNAYEVVDAGDLLLLKESVDKLKERLGKEKQPPAGKARGRKLKESSH